jgi:hypothetical protein
MTSFVANTYDATIALAMAMHTAQVIATTQCRHSYHTTK